MKKYYSKFLLRMLALIVLIAVPGVGHAGVISGDVNGDGKVSIDDVTTLINYLLTKDASQIVMENADVESDGRISIDDVTGLINQLLTQNNNPQPDEGDWVDLGLPSGTIWATRNVGAGSPEDYGDYFAWGETVPKSYYSPDTYKWWKGYYDADGYFHCGNTKYCTNSFCGLDGFVDNKTELDPSDDAACAHYPGGRMPSQEQIGELCSNCTWTWTQRNGVNGQLVTGPNGNTMFLPAAGGRRDESLYYAGTYGFYWSRTLYPDNSDHASYLGVYSGYVYGDIWYRDLGLSVRAVRVS